MARILTQQSSQVSHPPIEVPKIFGPISLGLFLGLRFGLDWSFWPACIAGITFVTLASGAYIGVQYLKRI